MFGNRTATAMAVVVSLLAITACGSDPAAAPPTTVVAPGGTDAGAIDPTDPGGSGASTTPTSTASDAPNPGGPAQPADTTSSPAPSPSSGPASTAAATAPPVGGVGAFAGFYLRPAESRRLVLEIGAQAGAAPSGATLDHVQSVLRSVAAKSVDRDGPVTVPDGARSWSADDLRALADRQARTPHRSDDAAVMRLLFLRGNFDGNESVLGVAVRSDVAAVFVDRVKAASGPLLSAGAVEDAVTMHEVGHLLGLVDNFLDTGRADPEHPGHSRSQDSVMYWAVESDLIGQVLAGGPPRDFDAADLADLAQIRSS